MITRGLIFGKFAPLTQGHVHFIREASMQVDHLFVFLSFDTKWLKQQPAWVQPKLGLTERLRGLKSTIRDEDFGCNITIDFVDESDIPGYPEGSAAYAKLIRAKQPFVKFDKAFSSEPEYESYFNEFFPEAEHIIIDAKRKAVPISATMIREDPFMNFRGLSYAARPRFTKRIAIVGVESTGKTTMAKRLAELYKTEWIPEVGRHVCEQEFHSDESLMTREDYLDIAYRHRQKESRTLEWVDAGVMFSDTTNLITHFSALCAGRASMIDPMFKAPSKEEGDNFYDLVLYLQPDVPWVADPLRLQDTPEKRKETNCLLDMMIRNYYSGTHVVKIGGSDYEDRLRQAVLAVEQCIHQQLPEIE